MHHHAPLAAMLSAATVLAALATGPTRLVGEAKAPRPDTSSPITVVQDEKAGLLDARIDGNTAFTFHYGQDVDLPYIVPRSPSGKPLTVVQTNPYPHHRSLWFADTVQLAGQRKVSFYNAYYSRADKKDPNSPFRDRIRVVKIEPPRAAEALPVAAVKVKLLWEMDRKTPVLDESRVMILEPRGRGEYLLTLTFTVTAGYGDVAFVSDAVHYAWPYVRMSPTFSVDKGGTMTSSEGGVNQKGTHNKAAWWIDYSNTVGGVTEGLALLVHPSGGGPPKWLTRDYGTFGPRRDDAHSGRSFTLKKAESLEQRVAIFVHRGDVKAAKVAQQYEAYAGRTAGKE